MALGGGRHGLRAGLPILALAATGAHFVVVFGFPYVLDWLPRSRWTPSLLQVSYLEDAEVPSNVMVVCTQYEVSISRLQLDKTASGPHDAVGPEPSVIDTGNEVSGEGAVANDPAAKGHRHDVADGSAERVTSVLLYVQGTRSVAKLAVRLSEIKASSP